MLPESPPRGQAIVQMSNETRNIFLNFHIVSWCFDQPILCEVRASFEGYMNLFLIVSRHQIEFQIKDLHNFSFIFPRKYSVLCQDCMGQINLSSRNKSLQYISLMKGYHYILRSRPFFFKNPAMVEHTISSLKVGGWIIIWGICCSQTWYLSQASQAALV